MTSMKDVKRVRGVDRKLSAIISRQGRNAQS